MHSLNRFEKTYSLEELKRDWMFKLLYKFFKHYGLWDKITENHPLSITKDGKNRIWGTMHSNNYCVSKMFTRTISCSIPWHVETYASLKQYDLLWMQFLKQHTNVIPQDIKEYIEVTSQMSIDAYIDNQYKIYEREYIK